MSEGQDFLASLGSDHKKDPFAGLLASMIDRLYNPPTDMTPQGRLCHCIDTLTYLTMHNAKIADGSDTDYRMHNSFQVYIIKAMAEWENEMSQGSFIQDTFFPGGIHEIAPKSTLWGSQ